MYSSHQLCKLKESDEPIAIQCLPVPLQDNQAFQLAEQLLSSIDLMLRRDSDRLWLDRGYKEGFHPFLLSLSIHGLSLLCNGL